MSAVTDQRQRLESLRADSARAQAGLATTSAQARAALGAAEDHLRVQVRAAGVAAAAHTVQLPTAYVEGWNSGRWAGWELDESTVPRWLRIGTLWVSGEEVAPAMVPFVGSYRPIVIRSKGADGGAAARALLQSIAVRTVLLLPHAANFYLVDPYHVGRTFPMSASVPGVAPRTRDVAADLKPLFDNCERITHHYPETPLDQLPDDVRLTERFNVVLAADFPREYDSRAMSAIRDVAAYGQAGAVLVVHHDLDGDQPGDFDDLNLRNAYVIDVAGAELSATWHGLSCTLRLDRPPGSEQWRLLLAKVTEATPTEPIVPISTMVDADPEAWWTGDSTDRVEAPIGRTGAAGTLSVVFGVDTENQPRAHAVQAAATGAGKSVLFHTFITSLATRYSPDELRLYLVDGKNGTEFQLYTDLPHAEAVSLQTPPELARSVVTELVDEMERRHKLFQAAGLDEKVREFAPYRQLKGKLPRLVLVIDEYQGLFEGDDDGVASQALAKLAEKGRSAGIHVYIASQGFDVAGLLNRDQLFRNVHTRIALQMSQEELDGLTQFGPAGRKLIRAHSTHVGRVVVNSRGGADDANAAGKVALATSDELTGILGRLRSRADAEGFAERRPVVFRGGEQPSLSDSAVVRALLALEDRSAPALEETARRPWVEGGFDETYWLAAESPLPLLLGRELSMHGSGMAVLVRRHGENAVLVGPNAEVLAATTAVAMLTAALSREPGGLEVIVADRLPPGGTWTGLLDGPASEAVRAAGHQVTICGGDIEPQVGRIEDEMARRDATDDGERASLPHLLLVGVDLDRVSALTQRDDGYGPEPSELGSRLLAILNRGPALGIHTWLGFRSMSGYRGILPDKSVRLFRHRSSLQISEDDSHDLFDSNAGAGVQGKEPRPIRSLYVDTQQSRAVRLLPYTTGRQSGPALADDLARIRDILAER